MRNKFLTALLSVVIAVGVWTYVITVENPESMVPFYNVPVVLQGESLLNERGLMLVDGQSPTVTLELYGNRKYLNKLKSSDITVVADLTKIFGPGEQGLPYDVSLPGDIPDNSVVVQSRMPDNVKVGVARRINKNVDVVLDFSGAVPEDFIVDKENPTLDYSKIAVVGPEEVVDRIAIARIDVDLAGRNESISESFRYTLCDAAGEPVDVELVTTNVEEVRLDLRIQRRKEIQLVVKILSGGGATEQTSVVTVEPKSIWVSGNDLALSGLDTLELGTIDLSKYERGADETFDVVLPEGITNESNVKKATVSIDFPGLKIREFSITEFKQSNVPEDMEVEFLTTQLKVSIRGPKEKINAMKLTDITVTVNFQGQEAGNATWKAEVTLGGDFADCGALGSYSVSATLRPKDEVPKQ